LPANAKATIDGFGRFGYTKLVHLSGIEFGNYGFRALNPNGDRFSFVQPLKQWQVIESSVWRQVILAEGGPGKPTKIRFDLFDYGVSLYCPAGLELKVRSVGAPFLTGKEGTFGPKVPTPESDWVGVSFQDRQPAFVFGFPEAQGSVEVVGEPGNWTIRTPKTYKGWIRVALPHGTESLQTTTAAAFGRLSQTCKKFENIWVAQVGDLSSPEFEEDAFGVEVTWNSPRKHSVIPSSLYLSPLGGYPVKILSKHSLFPSSNNEGPIVLSDEPTVKVRLPIRRIPIGRGLTVGEPFIHSLKPMSWDDPLNIVSTALENTLSGRSQEQSEQARDLLQSFYEVHTPQQEPLTKQATFYKQNGVGLLATAVHGMLAQSVRTGQPSEETEDPQLLSLFWRLDPATGSLGIESEDDRRIKSISAVAGCFSSSVKMRMQSAFFQAALSGERGLNIWKRRQGLIKTEPKLLEPLFGVRKGLFSLTQQGALDPVLSNWLSEIRCYGDQPTWITQSDFGFDLCWKANQRQFGTISVETSYPLNFSSKRNLKSLYSSQRFGYHELRYEPESPGECSANIYLPDWCDPLPITALPPTYTEATL
jgi:hypothetical protein